MLDRTEGGVLMSSQHHRHSLVLLSMDNTTVSVSSQSEARSDQSEGLQICITGGQILLCGQ